MATLIPLDSARTARLVEIFASVQGEELKMAKPTNTEFYYLDLIKFRNISNAIVDKFKVFHASPQVLVIKNGACVYDESHSGITVPDILAHI